MIIYTNHVPEGFAGCTNGFIIRIRPEYKDDKGLEAHEKRHVKQWLQTLGLHSLLYCIPKYRLWAEVDAYKEQLKVAMFRSDHQTGYFARIYAERIATKYNLNVTAVEAYKLLTT
jgi:hypothetical protein